MKKVTFQNRSVLTFITAFIATAIIASCNSTVDDDDDIEYTVANLAVKSFSFKEDSKVLKDLDSVFFSIDLNNGLIFNADSLPVGTDITRLIPNIEFATYLQKANFVWTDADQKLDSVKYEENMTDSIDFSNDVKLELLAADGINKFSYTIKVNVHTQKPDSMMWGKLAVAKLPSRFENPTEQKTVTFNDKTLSLVKEADNSMTLASSTDLFNAVWEKQPLSLPFNPQLKTLTATTDRLWILDTNGNLYYSADGFDWTSTGEQWISLIGAYLDSVLGIRESNNGLAHCHYPQNPLISDPVFNPAFPIEGRSSLGICETQWSDTPTALFIGGTTAAGAYSGSTWAFDGSEWLQLNTNSLPYAKGMTLFKYVIFRKTGAPLDQKKIHEAWYAFGGRKNDSSFNRDIYFSADNGMTWTKAGVLMTLPDYFPNLYEADGIVCGTTLQADLSEIWTRTDSRNPGLWLTPEYDINGYDISWVCPYLYIFGGNTETNVLSNSIWRGVIARLAFTPRL